jgi:hypothetical protein
MVLPINDGVSVPSKTMFVRSDNFQGGKERRHEEKISWQHASRRPD